jgi:DNA-binding NarL/FixJ family response regulator
MTTSDHRVRLVIVDDNIPFLESITRYFDSLPEENIDIVAKVTSGEEALAVSKRMKPDLILMDLAMPGMSGLDVARILKQEPNAPKILVLTSYGHDEYRRASHSAGADGFLAKTDVLNGLIPAIRSFFPVN